MNWLKAHWKDLLIGLLLISTGTFAYLWQHEIGQRTVVTGTALKLKESLQAQQDALEAGSMTVGDLQKLYRAQQNYANQLEVRLAATKKSLDSLGMQYRLMTSQYNNSQTDLKARMTELQSLQTRYDQLADANKANVASANELAGKNTQLAGQIQEVTGNFNELGRKNQQLTQAFNDLTGSVREKDQQIRAAQAQVAEANRDASQLNRQVSELNRKNNQLERQIDDLERRLKAAQGGGGGN